MLKLNININELIQKLIADNKRHVVRDSMLECKEDKIVQNEIVNYLSDDKLQEIINNTDYFKEFVTKYRLNTHFLDLAMKTFPKNADCFESIIDTHAGLLTIDHIKVLIENNIMKQKILDSTTSEYLSDEVFVYLHNHNYIKTLTPTKMTAVITKLLIGKEVKNMNQEELMAISMLRVLNPEELDFIIKKIFNYKDELKQKGTMEILVQYQHLPVDVIETIVKTWEYNNSDTWFSKLLCYQNIDTVLDYILKTYKLDNNQIKCIINNKATSRKILSQLYDNYTPNIIAEQSRRLPVLSCQFNNI